LIGSAGEGDDARGLGKLPGTAEGVEMCEGGAELTAGGRLLMRSSAGTGVARELGGGAVLEKRPAESRGGWAFLLMQTEEGRGKR